MSDPEPVTTVVIAYQILSLSKWTFFHALSVPNTSTPFPMIGIRPKTPVLWSLILSK